MPHCPRCGYDDSRPYLMSVDETRPGMVGLLRGEGGDAARCLVTVALCLLGVLAVAATVAVFG